MKNKIFLHLFYDLNMRKIRKHMMKISFQILYIYTNYYFDEKLIIIWVYMYFDQKYIFGYIRIQLYIQLKIGFSVVHCVGFGSARPFSYEPSLKYL